jgi:hypothetical protein
LRTARPYLLLFLLLTGIGIGCKRSYTPPAIKVNLNLLVVDGILTSGSGVTSTFNLSRTNPLTDTTSIYTAEHGAEVTILGSAGDSYACTDIGTGAYLSAPLTLNPSETYQLKIVTSNGSQYLSDPVPVLPAPPIDSLGFQQQDSSGNVLVNINTHDPTGNSHYYRWFFTETWQYRSEINPELTILNNQVVYVDSTDSVYNCYRSDASSDILIGTSSGLSQDRISEATIATIPRGAQKISVRYSMLASQYVLTQTAYQYWLTIEHNTQNLGSLFDPQPSTLNGNYHCISNPNEPVIGYLSAGSIQQKRYFIDRSQITNWDTVGPSCPAFGTQAVPYPYGYQASIADWATSEYGPYYFSASQLILSYKVCVDCRVQGGTVIKPSFW